MINRVVDKYQNLSTSIKASLWFLLSSFLQKGISFITTPIFTRILSTAEYGQYSIFNSWLSICSVFVSLNLHYAFYARGIVNHENDKDEFTSSILGLTTFLVICWAIIFLAFRNFWERLFSLTFYQVVLMLIIVLATSSFNFWSMQRRFEFKYIPVVALTLIVSFAKPILGIILITISNDKVTARILAIALVEVVGFFWCYFSLMKKGKIFYIRENWKSAIIFAVPLIPHYLSVSVLSGADKIMIEKMIDSSAAGIYGLAYSVAQIMLVFNQALNQTIEPLTYKYMKANNFVKLRKLAYLCISFIALVNLVLIAIAPEIVRLFAPTSYYDAVHVIPPIAMGTFFRFFYNFFAIFEFYYCKTGFVAMATTIAAILNIVLNYVFIGRFGYIAAGYTTLICYLIYTLAHYYFMTRIVKEEYGNGMKPYNPKVLVGISFLFLSVGFLFLFTYKVSIVRYLLIMSILVGLVLFRRKILGQAREFVRDRKEKE